MSHATVKRQELRVTVPGQERPVSALLDEPGDAHSLLVLAHGAGAGMRHAGMEALATRLWAKGIATFRYQFPYMEKGSKRPDSPPVAVATVAAAVDAAAGAAPGLPLFAGGKSFGGRMTTTARAEGALPSVRGIVCFGFPLHPAKKPATGRAEHLARVTSPILFIQGSRDDLADLTLLQPLVARHPAIELHVVEGADHGFAVLKSSGRKASEVLEEVGTVCSAFCRRWSK